MSTTAVAPKVGAFTRANPYWIDDWRPDDPDFWEHRGGKQIARRNLIFSVLSEHACFAVWSLWSVFVLFLGPEYGFTAAQKFLLTAAPTAVGAFLRLPYSFAVMRFGGRNWTIFTALLMLVPCTLTGIVLEPGVAFRTLLVVALVAGVGGGNFASSMANVATFYPQSRKGWALGLNAGGGNLGVALAQLIGLGILATAGASEPRLILMLYIPLVVVAAIGASLFMNNLTQAKSDKRAIRDAVRERHTWVMAFLYIGTFGSFIGFSFAFGQVLLVQFPQSFTRPIEAASFTFLGPLIGALIRPVGGRLADRVGGARVTFWNFVAMAVAASVVLVASVQQSLPLFIVGFLTLFVFAGIGNGSTYKMIPAIFTAKCEQAIGQGGDAVRHRADARRLAGALIALAGAVGALGGVLINVAFRQSFLTTGNGNGAYISFLAFYAVCFVVTWVVYIRPRPGRLTGV